MGDCCLVWLVKNWDHHWSDSTQVSTGLCTQHLLLCCLRNVDLGRGRGVVFVELSGHAHSCSGELQLGRVLGDIYEALSYTSLVLRQVGAMLSKPQPPRSTACRTRAGPPLLTLLNYFMPSLPESEFPVSTSYVSEAPHMPLLRTGSQQGRHFQAG